MKRILRWPLNQFLRRALQMMVDQAQEQYDKAIQVWAARSAFGKVAFPKMPEILKRRMHEQ